MLRNGFALDCAREEVDGDQVRLYLLPAPGDAPGASNYLELPATSIVSSEPVPDVAVTNPQGALESSPSRNLAAQTTLTASEMQQMLARAGGEHDIDTDLLAAVIHAESGGRVHAVSHAGAQGLMQLMPGTAAKLGVENSFAPEDNIRGGTSYLDQLLTRYHENLALALAAYNAGPAAVDRYHGIPPFAETRAYVARVIREFNRRKLAALHRTDRALAAATPLVQAKP